ncbi:MAG TPA: M56 family metallopeptidase [Thermoanaerobaculia bacterium]|nr:M56 family metallopeptidase [Thermoanaerobaculia bacterium]
MDTIFAVAERLQSMNVAGDLMLILVKATVILLIARLLLAAIPRASAATKHLIATATLVAVACMPLLSVVVPAWQVAVTRRVVPAVVQSTAPEKDTIGLRDDESVGIARSLVEAIAPAPVSAVTRAASVVRSTWKGFVVLAIALVALAFLGHMLTGMIGVAFVARKARDLESDVALLALDDVRGQLGLKADVRLLQSSRVSVPVIWGLFRPVLLLPEDATSWSEERMRVVLLHELAHLKRVDGISLILTRIAISLFWFHPLAWSLERAGRNECERACDDLVLASGTRPSDYADHLLGIARTMPAFDPFRAVTLAMSRKSQLEGRLLSILQPGVARRVFSGRGVAIACAVAVAIVVPVSALRLIAQLPEKQQAKQEQKEQVKLAQASGSTVDVRPEVDTLGDYLSETFSHFEWKKSHEEKLNEQAFDLYKSERYAEAGEAFRRAAVAKDGRDATALYNAACSYALANDAGRATDSLKEALAAGWDDFEKIAEDSDFDAIRDDARFANLLGRYGSDIATRRLNYTVERYNEMRSSRTASSDDWYEVGTNLLSLRRLDESLDALQRSLQSGEKHSATLYNIACAHSLRGDLDAAVTYLDKAIEDGYGDEEHMQQDRDLAKVRGHARFPELLRKADDLELRSRSFDRTWREAAAWHKRMLDKYPDSGRAWFNYGYTSLQARDYENGIAAFQRTLAMKYRPATSAYNIACAYALQDNVDAAFQWLERAQATGFDIREQAKHDEDLDSLHDDPRWRGLVAMRAK